MESADQWNYAYIIRCNIKCEHKSNLIYSSYSANISSISSHCGNLQFFLFTSNCKPTPSSTRSNMSNEPVKRPFSISEIVVLLTLVFFCKTFLCVAQSFSGQTYFFTYFTSCSHFLLPTFVSYIANF